MGNAHVSARRAVPLCLWSLLVGALAFAFGRGLLAGIHLCSNLFFRGQASLAEWVPTAPLPLWAALVPALGALAIGLVARYVDPRVRGHGIPEVIESVLAGESRIPWRLAVLKPLCSALSIGSGGPFGAEGPVIGLGGSLGSLLGQALPFGPRGRKILLAGGAAAGITAIFGCPVAATLLSLELLLYEFSPLSLTAVGLASATAACLRLGLVGSEAIFSLPPLPEGNAWAPAFYTALGLPLGLAAAGIIRAVGVSERAFERLPVHWMWWPPLGGLAVGLLGLLNPSVLGPGYEAIRATVSGQLAAGALAGFVLLKAVAWVTALGSGTSGGTLAPLLGMGAGLGALLALAGARLAPGLGLDPRMGAVVGMAAFFAGASHAPLASMLLAVETTRRLEASLPLLGACLLATLVCQVLIHHSIMTEGPAKRGIRVPRLVGRVAMQRGPAALTDAGPAFQPPAGQA